MGYYWRINHIFCWLTIYNEHYYILNSFYIPLHVVNITEFRFHSEWGDISPSASMSNMAATDPIWLLKLKLVFNLKISSSAALHMSSAQQPHVASSYCCESHKHRTFSSSQQVLLNSIALEDYVKRRKELPKDSFRNKKMFCQIIMQGLGNEHPCRTLHS